MYQTVNEHDFIDAFRQFDRLDTGTGGNFTPAGCRALFDYLKDFEESIGEPVELDVVALCCEFAEYENALEAWLEHGSQEDYDAFDADDDEQRANCVLDWFRDNTTVIEIDDSDRVIIQAF